MGSFTLNISADDDSKTKNADALKILTFILYYVYYNTFEEPLNKYFFERMTNADSEKKSISFNTLMGKLLSHMKENSKNTKKTDSNSDENSDENSESEAYSEIINLIAKELSSGLERDLFTNLQATQLISVNKALANDITQRVRKIVDGEDEEDEEDEEYEEDEEDEDGNKIYGKLFGKKLKQGKKSDIQSQSSSLDKKPIVYKSAIAKLQSKIEHDNNIRLFNILNIINATIKSQNNQLKYKLSLI